MAAEEATETMATETMEAEEWIDVCGDGGLLKKILKKGWGLNVAKKCEVVVNYHGTVTETGAVFDSTLERGEPYTCTLGAGRVIKGWELGIPSMVDGEKSILRCRQDYAYGEEGMMDKIPPGATIDFEVEILDTFEKTEVKGVRARTLWIKEDNYITLSKDARVEFEFKVGAQLTEETYHVEDSLQIDDLDTFDEYPQFFHKAMMEQQPDSHFIFEVQSSVYPPLPNWVGGAEVEKYYITVCLKEDSYTQLKSPYEMNVSEKIERADQRKERGNGYFKRQLFQAAIQQYDFGIKAIDKIGDEKSGDSETPEQIEKAKEIRLTIQSNLSMAFLKLGKHFDAITAATSVLKEDPNHAKALTRRARGYIESGEFELGRADAQKVLANDPNNDYCKKLDKIAKKKIAAYKKKQKKLAQKMFN